MRFGAEAAVAEAEVAVDGGVPVLELHAHQRCLEAVRVRVRDLLAGRIGELVAVDITRDAVAVGLAGGVVEHLSPGCAHVSVS